MTAEEKAMELHEKFLLLVDCGDNRYTTTIQEKNAKECAIIAVDEIINCLDDNDLYVSGETNTNEIIDYWQDVKNHLNKM